MKEKNKFMFATLVVILAVVTFSGSVFALTEAEVQQQVEASGKDAVSGNVFVWFLCAIAFLKISQKIDSFMSSLGINVGHTGDSMLGEVMMLTKGLTSAKGGLGGFGFGGGGTDSGSSGGSTGVGGGLAGIVSRQLQNKAIGGVTGNGGSFLSNQTFNSSLKKDGAFANGVIGAVAKGNMAQLGSITGDKASAALTSYMGYGQNAPSGVQNDSKMDPGIPAADSEVPKPPFSAGLGDTESQNASIPTFEPPDAVDYESRSLASEVAMDSASDSGEASPGSSTVPPEAVPAIPQFEDVEIGGGRITGREITSQHPQGREFALYHADQYTAPQGQHNIVTAVDDSKWYKQYAVNTVEKTPKMDDNGKIKYDEKIIQAMPPVPKRKDRI